MDIYDEIFNGDEIIEEDPRESEEEREERIKQEQINKELNRINSWNALIYYLADGDLSKVEAVYKSNAHLVMHHKLFEKSNPTLVKYIKGK